jgi:hypothetical protein
MVNFVAIWYRAATEMAGNPACSADFAFVQRTRIV